ncbi:hypothetical protein CFK39_14235 [Brachybacterium avium]|uniref:Uncharacterized protein n=1 Tax=Brachybacterium avium TaxID=2017485 RepID=A0A220UFV7_9MICO|nr:hypothetical protein CFK39_14235 [Brachybacterium avium]
MLAENESAQCAVQVHRQQRRACDLEILDIGEDVAGEAESIGGVEGIPRSRRFPKPGQGRDAVRGARWIIVQLGCSRRR